MSVIEHCPGEKPSADSPGCKEYFVIECDLCGECWEVGPKSEELEFNRHLCAECEKKDGMVANGAPPPSCSACVHFEQAKPYRWGLCRHPLPWWVESNSPTVHPYENNAKDCDCYMPNSEMRINEGRAEK